MSLGFVQGFKFTKLDSPIHKMDPRAKFVLTTGLFTAALMFTNILALAIIFLLQIPLILISKTSRRWLRSMRGGVFLSIFIFVMNSVFGTALILSIGFALRFFAIMSAFSFFFMTTSADDLGLALDQIHVPYSISFTFTRLAFQLVISQRT